MDIITNSARKSPIWFEIMSPPNPNEDQHNAQAGNDPGRIEIYITPYYHCTGPVIDVGPFSKGLAASNETEFVATISKMKESWNALSFPEMYVGAIRLYDLGFRNESVYWFYSAQYRGRLFTALLDQERTGSLGDPGFELAQAANAFQQLVGTYINGFAFGHVDMLIKIIQRVQHEGKVVPDMNRIFPAVNFISQSDWEPRNNELNGGMTEFLGVLMNQKSTIRQQRIENGFEAMFSKLTTKELPA